MLSAGLFMNLPVTILMYFICFYRYHLQALRHLYVLAAEPRVLVTREWDTSQSCSVPVRLHCQQVRFITVL